MVSSEKKLTQATSSTIGIDWGRGDQWFHRENINVRQLPPLLVLIGAKEISSFTRENNNVKQLPPLLILIGAKEISGFTRENINVRQPLSLLVLTGTKETGGFIREKINAGNFLHYWY